MRGRPTLYDESMIDRAYEYMNSCGREATELPTMEGLALELDVDADTLLNWAKEHELFGTVLKKLKSKQKNQLINDGLYGGKEVNPAMAIFLLKANHGLLETNKVQYEGIGVSGFPDETLQ